jgi:hypothetical protein
MSGRKALPPPGATRLIMADQQQDQRERWNTRLRRIV